ncbi:T9SS type A sorting domain-containing protein [Lutibacter sp.]|uniref:T9SS type A sorting domain-containing protein n=1 Tax=Lutibacter sp. TaxID=1925666 RepID=UPI0025C50FC5|nr:T9SS type A sorting domain-containing protein [Lutibacter sp.]MCF6182746.1 T9SS type A sorting domain-containing protein [Lutibacter sp.]
MPWFTGVGNRQVELYINGVSKGTSIQWDNTSTQTFSVTEINLTGNVIIEIRNITEKQVVIDDISWTCYSSTLATNNYVSDLFNVYPNPSTNNDLTISVKNNTELKGVQLYNTLGQLIIDIKNPKKVQNKIQLKNIPSGIYILKVFNTKEYSSKRIIIQ